MVAGDKIVGIGQATSAADDHIRWIWLGRRWPCLAARRVGFLSNRPDRPAAMEAPKSYKPRI